MIPFENDAADAARQTRSLAGLALVLGLVVTGLYLIDALRVCAASGYPGN